MTRSGAARARPPMSPLKTVPKRCGGRKQRRTTPGDGSNQFDLDPALLPEHARLLCLVQEQAQAKCNKHCAGAPVAPYLIDRPR